MKEKQRLANKYQKGEGDNFIMERSLVLIKPDAIQKRASSSIINRLEGRGLKIVGLKMLHLDEATATRHYDIHIGKAFFNDLIKYITSTPLIAIAFEGKGAVDLIRKTMGATDPTQAEAGTIRYDFGTDIQNNAVHGSDSIESAKKELELFFSKDETFNY